MISVATDVDGNTVSCWRRAGGGTASGRRDAVHSSQEQVAIK